jgi:hypothetical protein
LTIAAAPGNMKNFAISPAAPMTTSSAASKLALRDRYDELLEMAVAQREAWVTSFIPSDAGRFEQLVFNAQAAVDEQLQHATELVEDSALQRQQWHPAFAKKVLELKRVRLQGFAPVICPQVRLRSFQLSEDLELGGRGSKRVVSDLTLNVSIPLDFRLDYLTAPLKQEVRPFDDVFGILRLSDAEKKAQAEKEYGWEIGDMVPTPKIRFTDSTQHWRLVVAPMGCSTRQTFERLQLLRSACYYGEAVPMHEFGVITDDERIASLAEEQGYRAMQFNDAGELV